MKLVFWSMRKAIMLVGGAVRSGGLTVSAFCFLTMVLSMMVSSQTTAIASEDKLVIAHRGASGYLPEHTLAAKAMAYAQGADFIEQDVVLTQDDVPIVMHDIHLDTTTDVATRFPERKRADGRYYAIDFTLAEIRTLSVHERIKLDSGAPAYPKRFPQGKSAFRIATLAEEIELIQGLNRTTGRDVGIFPEIKAPEFHHAEGRDLSRIVVDMLASYGYRTKSDKAIIQCFDWAETRRIREELGYQGRLTQLFGENDWKISPATDYDALRTPAGLAEIAKVADGIGPWVNQIVTGGKAGGRVSMTSLVADARAAGLTVYPYTARADALPDWAADFEDLLNIILFDADADGIFTDFPDKTVMFVGGGP